MELLLLELANFRWYIRYPAAASILIAAWWLLEKMYPKVGMHAFYFPVILAICAMILIKEISPSLLLIAVSIWLWPTGFFDTPFAYMTFGIIFQFVGAIVLFSLGIFTGVKKYADHQYAMSTPTISPEVKRRQELEYDK